MTSVSLEEKRLKQLKQQLFGKEQSTTSQAPRTKSQVPNNFQFEKPAHKETQNYQTVNTDPISLKQDLLKIVGFSFAALAIQLSLFFASKQGLINFLH